MDGSADQPPVAADAQPNYPPMAQEGDPHRAAPVAAGTASPQANHHARQPAPSSGYAYGAPGAGGGAAAGGGGGSAMSALTAAAAAAKPAVPASAPGAFPPTLPRGAAGPPPGGHPGGMVVQHQQHQHQHQQQQQQQRSAVVPQIASTIIVAAPPAPKQQHHPPAPVTLAQVQAGPPGKVVESGHEHTGRWTKEEHEAFLSALQLYGKEWKKVAARVKTRTVVQTRTHAQKYFQKLQKVLEVGGEKEANTVLGMVGGTGITLGATPPGMSHTNLAAMMDLGVPNSNEKKVAKKRGTSRVGISAPPNKQHQQNQQQQQQLYQPPTMLAQPPAAISSSNSATAAALLNMSNDRRLSATSLGPPSTTTAGAYSSVPQSSTATAGAYSPAPAPHAAHSTSSSQQHQHGFTTAANATASVADSSPAAASVHGFGYPPAAASTGATTTDMPPALKPLGGISIVAPTHEDMVLAGKFPEPSPAACGKRKLAEIAAAQMLAGVVGTVARENSQLGADGGQPALKKRASVSGAAASDEPIAAEGTTLLPPEDGPSAHTSSSAPVAANELSGSAAVQSMSLQIVNPDTLVDQGHVSAKRRFMNGQASPSTPWDGQLEALVSHVKRQEVPNPLTGQDPTAPNDVTASDETPINEAEVMDVSQLLLPLPLRSPRSTLQMAVCNGSVHEVSQICTLSVSNPAVLNERDDAGFHPLHSVSALGLLDLFGSQSGEATEICRLLLDCGADVTCRDTQGNTPVHWAARAGHWELLGLLLMRSCPLDVPNDGGETALHWAMRAGDRGGDAVKVLVENGARVNVFNRNFRRPLDVAAEGFAALEEEIDGSTKNDAWTAGTYIDQRVRRSTRWNLMRSSSQCRTLVLHHQECLEHLAKSEHDWEVPDRIRNIMSTLTSRTIEPCDPGDEQSFMPCEVTVSNEFERATLELLSRIHSAEYLAFVNDLSKELERKRKQQLIENAQSSSPTDRKEKPVGILPFTPMVQRKILNDVKAKEDGHSDTSFSAGSLKAARRAAGAVQHAVDCVLVGRNRNAFCIVRPPGHHAGINGLLSDAESCGFCLFNNVAAGAMHALSDEKHRPRCERCAIVDIDAHHGNGTEEIVRKCHDSGRLLFFSVHLYDHDKPRKGQDFQYKFYPGTGAEDDVAHNIINVPIAPLWREKEVVKSISLASNGGPAVAEPRQTRQRSKEEAARRVPSLPDLSKNNREESVQASIKPSTAASTETASVASDSSQSSKSRTSLPSASPHYPPHYLMGVGRLAYRRAIQHRLIPALRAFNPDLIILSTGFDAARGDVGNARHFVNGTEGMGLDLEPEDYAWTARKVCEVADICCDGRVVSVLEGGYGQTPPPVPAPPLAGDEATEEPVKQKLDKSIFSECAIQHLKGLVDPYHAEEEQNRDSSTRKHP